MLGALQAAIPDVYVGEDGVIRIIFTIEAGQLSNLSLANQLALEDMFISSASLQALRQHGQESAIPMDEGTRSVGTLRFFGNGGTYVPIGTQVGYDPGNGLEIIYYVTTVDGTLPNPGSPSAPVAAINAVAGNLNGLYEYMVTFVTAEGETEPSPVSNAVSPVNQQVNLTGIPLGGPGTTVRRIYRAKDGSGIFRRIYETPNNTITSYTDNITDAVMNAGTVVPTVNTATAITLAGESEDVGIDKNAAIGAITILTNAPATLTDVVNQTAFQGGTDPEDTESYRQKLLTNLRNPQTGSPDDLKAWAERVAGVETATVFNNNNLGTTQNGHATVRISGPNGTVPGSDVITAVQNALNDLALANITIHVTTFNAVVTAVTVDVTTTSTYTLADVTPSVQTAIQNYINGLAVGETLYISGIIAAVKPLPGIADVTVTTPATNQTTAATDKRTPGTITVT